MSIQTILDRLHKVHQVGSGQYRACCPSHQSQSDSLALRELDDGRILIHCFAGCSGGDVMDSIGMSLSDLYPEPLDSHIRPLYMAQQEKRQQDKVQDEASMCRLRLEMADEMRERGMKLTKKDLDDERKAFFRLRQLEQRGAA